MILTDLAKAISRLGRKVEAKQLLIQSVQASREGGFLSTLALGLGLLGGLLLEENPLQPALDVLEEARSVAKQAGDRAAEVMALLNLAKGRSLDDQQTARGHFQEASALSRSIGARHLEAEAQQGLALVCSSVGDWEPAYLALRSFHDLSSSIHDSAALRQMEHLRADQARRENQLYQEQLRVMTLLGTIGQRMSASLDLESIVRIVDQSIGYLMAADVFGMGLYDSATQTIDYQLYSEAGKPVKPFTSSASDDSFSGWCIRNRQDILINDIARDHSKYRQVLNYPIVGEEPTGRLTRSGLFTPLIAEGRVLGVLSAQSYQLQAYTEKDLATFKTLASSIAIAIENASLFSKVTTLATVDALTGASTRRYLFDRTEQEFQGYLRLSQPLALIMIDLDHFKSFNDTWGHAVGDQVLAEFGALVQAQKRPNDIFGRYGGEEFAIVQPGTTLEGARRSAERLCQLVRALVVHTPEGHNLAVTASFGVTTFHADDPEVTPVFSRADEALYEAKQSGRDRVVVRP
jgi:diguanylate cyclase (GGDEF)-like protein